MCGPTTIKCAGGGEEEERETYRYPFTGYFHSIHPCLFVWLLCFGLHFVYRSRFRLFPPLSFFRLRSVSLLLISVWCLRASRPKSYPYSRGRLRMMFDSCGALATAVFAIFRSRRPSSWNGQGFIGTSSRCGRWAPSSPPVKTGQQDDVAEFLCLFLGGLKDLLLVPTHDESACDPR